MKSIYDHWLKSIDVEIKGVEVDPEEFRKAFLRRPTKKNVRAAVKYCMIVGGALDITLHKAIVSTIMDNIPPEEIRHIRKMSDDIYARAKAQLQLAA